MAANDRQGQERVTMSDREFWVAVRQALYMVIDAIERWQNIQPRLAEIRAWYKAERLRHGTRGGDGGPADESH